MKSKCILDNTEDSNNFNHQADIIFRHLVKTRDGVTILRIITDIDNPTSEQYLEEYYKNFELKFLYKQVALAKDYIEAVKDVRSFCKQYDKALYYINEMIEIMTQTKSESRFKIRSHSADSYCILS